MITVFSNNEEVSVKRVDFSDRAFTYKLDSLPQQPSYIAINVDPSTPVKDVREEVDMILSCIDNFYGDKTGFVDVSLNLPYMPYARQDRVFEKGNPSPLYDFLVWLDGKQFAKINVCDIHNDKVLEEVTVNNLVHKEQLQCFKESLPYDFDEYYDYVIAPDKGAMGKAHSIAAHLETNIAFAGKTRNISTGRIESFDVPKVNFVGAKVLIPDDIFDYGGTFLGLAKALKDAGAKQVDLYITHMIAANGLKMLDGVIDRIYYYHTVATYINDQDILNFNSGKI